VTVGAPGWLLPADVGAGLELRTGLEVVLGLGRELELGLAVEEVEVAGMTTLNCADGPGFANSPAPHDDSIVRLPDFAPDGTGISATNEGSRS
jgi:hypothetical protein